MTSEPLLLTDAPVEGVLVLRLNRPDKRNALSTPLLRSIADALASAAGDDKVRCAVITGSQRVFAAGADVGEMATKSVGGALADERPALWHAIRSFPKPLLGAVEGWCLGAGNELLMCCDIAVAGRGSRFGQPETNLAIIPGAGGTATLPRLVGRAAAMKMVLLGDPIDAVEAAALGLIGEVVDDGAALTTAQALAGRIAARAPLAMRQAKQSIASAFDLPHTVHLASERLAFSVLFGSDDKREGVDAFLSKREARWSGQ